MLDIGNTGGGDFTPWVKYNAKAGRWYIKDDAGDEMEVADPVFVADFDNIKTGWFYFSAGNAPERVLDPSLEEKAEKPRDEFKRGFMLNLFSEAKFGGVVELSGTANALCSAIVGLYEQYEVEKESHAGELPVVKVIKANPITNKHGTNYEPVMEIDKWVKRPAEFDDVPENDNTPAEEPKQAATGSVSEF